MAKLQGLFLSYKNQPEKQIEMTKELLEEVKTDDEMTIIEWLNRMNCIKYAKQFLDKRIFFLSDMRFFNFAEDFKEVVTDEDDSSRINSVLEEDELSKKDFQLLTKNSARQIIRLFIINKKLIEQIV